MKKSICVALLLVLCSCSANRSINDVHNIDVKVSSLGGDCFIGLPMQLLLEGDFLLINDFHEPFVKIIDKNSGETVNNICRKGNGPNEFFAPLQLIAEKEKLYVLHRNKVSYFLFLLTLYLFHIQILRWKLNSHQSKHLKFT